MFIVSDLVDWCHHLMISPSKFRMQNEWEQKKRVKKNAWNWIDLGPFNQEICFVKVFSSKWMKKTFLLRSFCRAFCETNSKYQMAILCFIHFCYQCFESEAMNSGLLQMDWTFDEWKTNERGTIDERKRDVYIFSIFWMTEKGFRPALFPLFVGLSWWQCSLQRTLSGRTWSVSFWTEKVTILSFFFC